MSEDEFLAWGYACHVLPERPDRGGAAHPHAILETPLFAELQGAERGGCRPVRETLVQHWPRSCWSPARIAENAVFYVFTTSVIPYGRDELGVARGDARRWPTSPPPVRLRHDPALGWASDRWTRRRAYMAGCCFLIAFAFPFFALLETRVPPLITLAIVIGVAGGHALLYSVQAALIPELFSTRLRCTGASIGYQLATPLAGGTRAHRRLPDSYLPRTLLAPGCVHHPDCDDLAGLRVAAGGDVPEGPMPILECSPHGRSV